MEQIPKEEIKKYIAKDFIVFSAGVGQKYNEKLKKWKKY